MIPVQKTSLFPANRVVLALFFSVFLLMGCGFTYFIAIRPLAQNIAARQWMTVPCRVLSSEVKSHSDSDGTTYSAEIAYAYQVGGKEYRSNRYRFLRMSSSRREANVVARYAPGSKSVCFVNPKNPSEAVLDREIGSAAWFGLIPLVFVVVGLVGVIGAIRSGKKKVGGGLVDGANPNVSQPWTLRPDWAAGRILSSTKKAMLGIWFFAGVWNLISLPIAGMVLSQHVIQKGNYGPAFVLLFPVIGMGLLYWAVTLTRRWLRFGESVFEMVCVPGAIGGALAGTIRPSRPFRAQGPVKLRLSCIARTTSSNGSDGSSTNERILWQHEETVEMSATDAIPAAFYIPEDCSETTVLDASDGTLWRLEAQAQADGADYAVQFEVPVFRVEQSPQQRAFAEQLLAREQAEVAAYVPPPTSRIRVQPSLQGGTEFYFPACRNPGMAIFLTLFLTVWSGVIWFMIHQRAPVLFPIVFGFFDVIMVFAAAYAWTGTTRVVVSQEGATVTSAVLGIPRVKTVAAQEIESIKPKVGTTSGTTVYHDLKIYCRDEREIGAGSAIKDSLEAEWLAAEMTKALAGK